jgi:hypothetical protein
MGSDTGTARAARRQKDGAAALVLNEYSLKSFVG